MLSFAITHGIAIVIGIIAGVYGHKAVLKYISKAAASTSTPAAK